MLTIAQLIDKKKCIEASKKTKAGETISQRNDAQKGRNYSKENKK